MTVLDSAIHEYILKLIHLVNELFTHGFAEGVTLAAGKATQQAAQEHDLFLVHGDTVSILEVFLHLRYVILDGVAPVLTLNELRDILHGPRTVKRVHGY